MRQNSLYVLALMIGCSICMNSASGQNGYLGHKFQLEAAFTPSLTATFLPRILSSSYYDSPDESIEGDDGVLATGSNGIRSLSLLSGSEFAFSYIASRKSTIGLSYGNKVSYGMALIRETEIGTWGDTYERETSHHVPLTVQTLILRGDFFTGIAPLKKYYRIGLGFDIISTNTAQASRAVRNEGRLNNYTSTVPFFALGFGGNYYVSKHIYVAFGVNANISFSMFYLDEIDNNVSNQDVTFLPFQYLSGTRLTEVKFGLGFSL